MSCSKNVFVGHAWGMRVALVCVPVVCVRVHATCRVHVGVPEHYSYGHRVARDLDAGTGEYNT